METLNSAPIRSLIDCERVEFDHRATLDFSYFALDGLPRDKADLEKFPAWDTDGLPWLYALCHPQMAVDLYEYRHVTPGLSIFIDHLDELMAKNPQKFPNLEHALIGLVEKPLEGLDPQIQEAFVGLLGRQLVRNPSLADRVPLKLAKELFAESMERIVRGTTSLDNAEEAMIEKGPKEAAKDLKGRARVNDLKEALGREVVRGVPFLVAFSRDIPIDQIVRTVVHYWKLVDREAIGSWENKKGIPVCPAKQPISLLSERETNEAFAGIVRITEELLGGVRQWNKQFIDAYLSFPKATNRKAAVLVERIERLGKAAEDTTPYKRATYDYNERKWDTRGVTIQNSILREAQEVFNRLALLGESAKNRECLALGLAWVRLANAVSPKMFLRIMTIADRAQGYGPTDHIFESLIRVEGAGDILTDGGRASLKAYLHAFAPDDATRQAITSKFHL